MLAERQVLLDSAEVVAAFAAEMSESLRTSEITETRAFVRSLVKAILVRPGQATIHCTIPMPEDSPLRGGKAEDVALGDPVLSTVKPGWASGVPRARGSRRARLPSR